MTRNQYSELTTTELLLAVANSSNPTGLELVLAERLEAVSHQLEDYETGVEVKTRYVE